MTDSKFSMKYGKQLLQKKINEKKSEKTATSSDGTKTDV